MREYLRDIEIDPTDLASEWLKQPGRFAYWSEMAANAQHDMDKAKEHVDITKAMWAAKVRSNPDGFGLGKGSETAILSVLDTIAEVQEAVSTYLDKKKDAEILQAAVSAFHQRKAALEYLVQLQLRGLNATPRPEAAGLTQEGVTEQRASTASRIVRRKLTGV